MENRVKVALYPVFADTLPVARYLERFCPDVDIVELLSVPGSCACGRDASFLDNRETFGKQILPFSETAAESWDVLYLLQHESLGLTEFERNKIIYEPMVKIASSHSRKVITYPYGRKNTSNNKAASTATFDAGKLNTIKKAGVIRQIGAFSVFVGGAVAETNAFEVMLNLFGELKKKKRVSAFSSCRNAEICNVHCLYDLLYDRSVSEEQRVFNLGDEINRISKAEKADMVIIQLDEALMPFSDALTGGFGIIPYMLSQVLTPDYCICCLPFGYTSSSFLQEFRQGLEGKLGFIPDHWHLSNTLLDFTTINSVRDAGAIHMPMNQVIYTLDQIGVQGISIGCDVLPHYFNNTCNSILASFHDDQRVSSILERLV